MIDEPCLCALRNVQRKIDSLGASDVEKARTDVGSQSTVRDDEEEIMMKDWLRAACFGTLIGVFAGSLGCAPIEQPPPPPSTPVSVSAFTQVAGNWAGILKATPRLRKDDWVTVTIHNDGSYQFKSVRTIGIMHGEGTFTLVDGKLKSDSDRGWIVATLYEEEGRRMLRVQAETKEGTPYSADLGPKK